MKNLFLLFVLTSLFSCKNNVDTYRAGIEELASNWNATTASVTEFGSSVQAAAAAQTEKVGSMVIDEAIFSKLAPEAQAQFAEAKAAAEGTNSGYGSILSEVGSFVSDWTAKGAQVTALTDGLTSGKLEGDIATQISDLTGMISDATGKLDSWKTALSGAQEASNTANEGLASLIATLMEKKK